MDDNCPALPAAIEELYSAFGRYGLAERVEGCPCCVSRDDEQRLRSAPLHRMSAGDLSKYAWKALTTWGDENDFRHFLPRLFELAADEPDSCLDVQVLFGKLHYGGWQSWPEREQEAISKYLQALWSTTLSGEVEASQIEERLCCLGRATDDIEPFLQTWIEPPDLLKLRLLAAWLGSGEALGGGWREPEPHSRARTWLLDARTTERLETAFFEGDGAIQAAASDALDGIAQRFPYYRGA